jgi:hypothetical protein
MTHTDRRSVTLTVLFSHESQTLCPWDFDNPFLVDFNSPPPTHHLAHTRLGTMAGDLLEAAFKELEEALLGALQELEEALLGAMTRLFACFGDEHITTEMLAQAVDHVDVLVYGVAEFFPPPDFPTAASNFGTVFPSYMRANTTLIREFVERMLVSTLSEADRKERAASVHGVMDLLYAYLKCDPDGARDNAWVPWMTNVLADPKMLNLGSDVANHLDVVLCSVIEAAEDAERRASNAQSGSFVLDGDDDADGYHPYWATRTLWFPTPILVPPRRAHMRCSTHRRR